MTVRMKWKVISMCVFQAGELNVRVNDWLEGTERNGTKEMKKKKEMLERRKGGRITLSSRKLRFCFRRG